MRIGESCEVPPGGSRAGDVPEASASRSRLPDVLPAAWLDRLLTLSLELPLCEGEHAVVVAMVDALAAILPDHALGACFVPELASAPRNQSVDQALA